MPIPKNPIKAALWKKRQSKAQKGRSKNTGRDNPFYGKKHSKEIKKKISRSSKGENNPMYGKRRPQDVKDAVSKAHKGKPSPFKGKHHSKKTKEVMSERSKGNKYRLGKNHTEETKEKISIITRQRTPKGKNHPRWKGGNERCIRLYSGIGYKAWRKDVFERDNYTCQKCGDNKGGNLRAHHKIPFKECLEMNNGLEFNINNGRTLCEPCHKELHSKDL